MSETPKILTWEDLKKVSLDDLTGSRPSSPDIPEASQALTAEHISKWLGASGTDQQMKDIAAAVTAYVNSLPSIDRLEGGGWAHNTALGATMLGARLYKRKVSPSGIESFAQVGFTFISRYDSDIARLLHIDAYRKPIVG